MKGIQQAPAIQLTTNAYDSGISSVAEPASSTVELENGNNELGAETIGSGVIIGDDDEIYPEKNIRGWLAVLGAFFGGIPCWGMANSIGVIQTQLLEHELKGVPTTTVSWIFSINVGLTMCCTIFSGAYFDRNGATAPMLVGSCIAVG
ncbi:unnamed protein product [Ambrosiozyma monospora]|uniref:Unnamed protein product n=1 Tax=Ambrosiozyma monospora TaxID=43982 RepID=A0ACB5T122_AMBMO|nr:unnamed protein product [Ambrosiozyma monospora]